MNYKPDHYHQTNPPCELKRDVMGRQGSKKGQKESTTEPVGSDAETCLASFDRNYLFRIIMDAERALKRCGIRPEKELGGVCDEIRVIHERMKNGDFATARAMTKDPILNDLPNVKLNRRT